jgi:hypothetical protein
MSTTHNGPRQAAYDRKKLRGKHIVARIGRTRRYEALPSGLQAMTALIVLRNKAIKPLLAAAQPLRASRGAHNPKPSMAWAAQPAWVLSSPRRQARR